MFKTGLLTVALAFFGFGTVFKISAWFRHGIGVETGRLPPKTRLALAGKGVLATLLSLKIVTLLQVFVNDILLQRRLLRHEFLGWLAHMCIYGGFMMLLLMHGLDQSAGQCGHEKR
jgi:hypothetical protein